MLRSMRRFAHRTDVGALRGTDPARTWRAGARYGFWLKGLVLQATPGNKGCRAVPMTSTVSTKAVTRCRHG
jgi:hypothetical protein